MAHNIHFNENTGTHSFFSVKEKVWHGLGQLVDGCRASAEAIQLAGLDYQVVKTPLFTSQIHQTIQQNVTIFHDELTQVPGYYATCRLDSGRPLGVVGSGYQVVQNRDAFTFFDSIADGKGVRYETAGALGHGERIFITAKIDDHIIVGKDDLIEQYLFLTNSHDGSGSITVAFTPVRIVCQNTLNAAMEGLSSAVRVRHTASATERLAQAHKLMGLAAKASAHTEAVFNSWAKIKITDGQLKRLIQMAMAPGKETLGKIQDGELDLLSAQFNNTVDRVFQYALASPEQLLPTTEGTLFGAYNAVTGYFQNVRYYKTAEDKTCSIMFGGNAAQRGQAAFNFCQGFADFGPDIFNAN
jgi:phage/plasmid-like protein (TIGR03299 family)